MKILVVGGAGYIGSHTCKALKKAGYEVVVYDNMKNGNAWAVKWGPLVVGDILERQALDRVFEEYRFDAVMHFASLIDARASMEDPTGYYENNVVGTLRLLEAMKKHGVKKLVFSSSAAVYGMQNVYGRTKWMAEQMIQDFGMESVILRYFNAAGADPELEIGEAHTPETHLIPNALKGTLQVFGDGSAVRDYVHVSDLADAHVKALEIKGPSVFNLGSGKGHSLNEVLAMVEKVTGKKVVREMKPAHPNEPSHLVADTSLAESLLGWKPLFSDLETIVSTAHKWATR